MVRVRSSLAQLPPYVPGRKMPGAIALASNESPYGLLPGVAARLAELAGGVSRYPDLSATALVRALAEHHGVETERIALGAGSSEVCAQLLHSVVGPGDEVVFGWRSFEAYPILTAVAGGTAVRVPLREHGLDLDAMAEAVGDRTRLVFVCNPNNPTSTAVGEQALRDFADRVPQDVMIVVDEAYREYADPELVPDALALLGDRPNVVVLRTFSKAYGLAGLRVGYCVAPPGIAEHVRKTQIPFSVSALAQEAATVALGEHAEVVRRAALTVAERQRVTRRLRDLGFEVPGSEANFVWLPLAADSGDFALHCLGGDVVVRPFAGEGVRVTIGLRAENDALLAAAASWRG
ncbi:MULTISPECIES: histidinol-phosphate transaminase [Streptomyces]|uniref:Histidinol-phosphate aminotransferase n=1 Tax=Streptomyces caniscabiei TaxID=2746961 RepID=A0ABU4N4U1_9ACTN|nr:MULTISPECIES: histidinol-phosphate transaminase [Streptomyces]MBE4739064.1 histidinol-phosphate transaminase [Streptomyces caniscabiei]MBE4762670.1 histidinol-phosphate transaminase [Streptomyces caniscabiei]MBE4772003.1 histidinol-phosphate transaminase [Streptomyces caniscabiei]MBE4788064.1 histidinol-phosphate transaminase [Streptomyces caniscabiei]MBE4797286.1 histidinol-phosphate transaminase [Streptomyces caniscabiei]